MIKRNVKKNKNRLKQNIIYYIINMVNYHNGKIYKIVSDSEPNKVYIGSTTQQLSKRLGGHVSDYICFLNGKHHFVTSFDLLKNNDYQILLIENVNCENKEELHKKEGEWIRKYKNDNELEDCINKHIAGRTKKEYNFDNKVKVREYKKQYHEDNRDKISKKKKLYRENNKDKIKEYRENNKDKMKEYYEKNKDKIKENNRIKVNCQYCNCNINKCGIVRHHKTIKCKAKQLELNITI